MAKSGRGSGALTRPTMMSKTTKSAFPTVDVPKTKSISKGGADSGKPGVGKTGGSLGKKGGLNNQ